MAGLFVALPSFITGYILWLVFSFVDRLLGSLMEGITGTRIPGMGFLAVVVLLLLAGLITTNYIGKRAIQWIEGLLAKIPVVGGIYGTTRQFAEALSSPERGVFRRVVMLQYPRAGIYSLGFLTGEAPDSLSRCSESGSVLYNVFIPTPPNPTTGFLIHVPGEDLLYPLMSVDEGMKFILSAGVVQAALTAPEREVPG